MKDNEVAIKILFLTRSLNVGGAEQQLVVLVQGLHKQGLHPQVVSLYSGGALEHTLKQAGVPVFSLNKRGRWDNIRFFFRLLSLLRREKPDILHGYLPVPNLMTVVLKPFFPGMKILWGIRASHIDLQRYDWLSSVTFRAQCVAARFADMIIANSRAGKDYHVQHGFPGHKITVIPNGIDTERFKPDTTSRAKIRSAWNIADRNILIGLVARFDPMKDHPTFLQAAAILSRQYEDVRFVCVGDGPYDIKTALKAQSEELGMGDRIVWAGPRSDMPAVYSAMDIVVCSSYGEGFPNVIGEAMACGIPCVVTDVGDAAWIVADTGIVVPPRDPDALAGGVRSIVECLVSGILPDKSRIRARIVNEFNARTLVDRTIAALHTL